MSINKLESNLYQLSLITNSYNIGTEKKLSIAYQRYVDRCISIIDSTVIDDRAIHTSIQDYVLKYLQDYRINPGFMTNKLVKLDQDPGRFFIIKEYLFSPENGFGSKGFNNFIIQSIKPDVSYDKISIDYKINWDTSTSTNINVELDITDIINYNQIGLQYGGEDVNIKSNLDLYIKYLN